MKVAKINITLLVNSINKNQIKDSWRADCTGRLLATSTFHTLLLQLKIKSANYFFQVQVMFVWARYKSVYIYIITKYVNKNHHSWSPRLSFIIHKRGVSPFYGLLVASLRVNQFYIKIDKLKIKPYLQQVHSIA